MSRKQQIKEKIDHDLERDALSIANSARDKLSLVGDQYLRAVTDPTTAKPCRIPTLIGGEPGLTSTLKLEEKGSFFVGSLKVGYLQVGTPDGGHGTDRGSGFYSDRSVGSYSNSSYAFATILGGAVTGVTQLSQTTSPYLATANTFAYRQVGCVIKVTPVSSALDQNGLLALLEPASHSSVSGNTPAQILSWKRTRVVRGAQLGSISQEVALNMHPVSFTEPVNGSPSKPFDFIQNGNASATHSMDNQGTGLLVMATGTPGTEYEFVVTWIYEYRGKGAPANKAGLTDARSMNLVLNSFRAKGLSGWIGSTEHAHRSYLTKIWDQARKLEPQKMVKGLYDKYQRVKPALNALGTVAGFAF